MENWRGLPHFSFHQFRSFRRQSRSKLLILFVNSFWSTFYLNIFEHAIEMRTDITSSNEPVLEKLRKVDRMRFPKILIHRLEKLKLAQAIDVDVRDVRIRKVNEQESGNLNQ